MARSLVATMEYVMVEMVEKVVVEMGYLVEKEEEEEGGEDGVVVVVVVGMEERKVEKLVEMVVEMEVGMVEHGRPKEGKGLPFRWLLGGKGRRKEK